MSHDHTSCCGAEPEAESQLVHAAAIEAVRMMHSEQMQQRSTARVFTSLSKALVQASMDLEGPLDAGKFLTRMKLLSDESSLGLMVSYRPSANVYKLMVLPDSQAIDGNRLLLFKDEEARLNQTRFVEPTAEEHTELLRQLSAIQHAGYGLFAVISLKERIPGYEYVSSGEASGEDLESPVVPAVNNEPEREDLAQPLVEQATVGTFDASSNVRALRAPGPTLVKFDD